MRVSTDMQAAEGMSLEAQQAAIEGYRAIHGIKLVKICKDVISGGKDVRPGLGEALRTLQTSADFLIVLKFDRLSRSIKHFCELCERYFKDGTKGTGGDSGVDSGWTRRWGGLWWESSGVCTDGAGGDWGTDSEAIGHIKRSGVSLWESALWEADDSLRRTIHG